MMKNLKGILTHGQDGEFVVTLGLIAVPLDRTLARSLLSDSMRGFLETAAGSDTDAMVKMAQKCGSVVAVWDEDFSVRIMDSALWNAVTESWMEKLGTE